jgi:flotillin
MGLQWIIPIAVIFLVIGLVFLVKIGAKYYIKVPPNKAAIFYGKNNTKIITSGAKLRIPIVEDVAELDLNTIPIELQLQNAPNKDGVLVSVKAVANVKVKSDQGSLKLAAERFLGMERNQIKDVAYQNLEGHLRAIVGRMTVEEMVGDRNKIQTETTNEAAADLGKIGMEVDLFIIQEIRDQQGYIEALGKKRTQEVIRDAEIGTANAKRDAVQQSTTADQEAATTKNGNLAKIAEAEKDKDVKQAEYRAFTAVANAKADQAGPLAKAEANKAVVTAEIEVEKERKIRETEVATQEALRKEQELLATIVKPAEANKKAIIEQAEGEKMTTILAAEAQQKKTEFEGIGKGKATEAEGMAEAMVIKAKLFAEADGIKAKADALKELNDAGQLIIVLDKLGEVGPKLLKELAGVVGAATQPIGSVDSISIVDFGGSDSANNGLMKLASFGPEFLTKLMSSAEALGLNTDVMSQLFKKALPDSSTKKEEKTA